MRRMGWAGAITAAAVALGGVWGLGNAGVAAAGHDAAERRGCSEATLRGAFGIQMQGTRPSAPGGAIESVVGVVIRHYDGHGEFTQVDNVKGSISGLAPDRPGSGTYTVNADCTGATLFQPGPGLTIQERFVIVDKGREVRSMVASPLPVMMTTVQKKIDGR
jgi:hypothetical protein